MITRSLFPVEGVEIRRTDDGKATISGYAVMWEKKSLPIMDSFREQVRAGAFLKSIEKNNIRALWNHNTDMVLGSTKSGSLRLTEDDKGLRFELDPADTQAGRDAVTTIERGDVDGMSFGFNVRKQEWDEADPKNILRTIVEADLREISPTPFPAYPQSRVTVRSVEDDYKEYSENEKRQTEDAQIAVNAAALKSKKMAISTF